MLTKTKSVDAQLSKLEDVRIFFETLREKQLESYENKSENWQSSDKGQEAEENITELETIINSLEVVAGEIENLFEE